MRMANSLTEKYRAQACIILLTLGALALALGIVIGYFIKAAEVSEEQQQRQRHLRPHHGDADDLRLPAGGHDGIERVDGDGGGSYDGAPAAEGSAGGRGGTGGSVGEAMVAGGGANNNVSAKLKHCRAAAIEDPAVKRFLHKSEIEACQAAVCRVDLPRVYVVYKLTTGHIDIDGKLDERAWEDVAWTETFVDIEGEGKPQPRFESKVKLRYDDNNLYIGAYLQEYAVWANRTLHDSTIYQDNSFQVLLDTTQCNHKYKEISINALGTVADVMLTRPYMDDGEPLIFWESEVIRAIHIEGPINDPTKRNKFWTVEMAIPFKQLYAGLGKSSETPLDREIWRGNFVRSEWQTEIVGSKYLKRLDLEADWWVWHSPGVSNIHIPDLWGLLQFRDAPINSTSFQADKRWVTTNALLDVYRAQKAYKAVTGRYTQKKELLDLPPYVHSERCLRDLDLQLDWGGFRVTARPAEDFLEDGHIRTDRFLWFGAEKENFFRRRK